MPKCAVVSVGKHRLAKLGLSLQALTDLFNIGHYGAEKWGSHAADEFVANFNNAFALIERHPNIGRPRDEYPPGIRSWQHRRYILYHRHGIGRFEVNRIMHASAEPSFDDD